MEGACQSTGPLPDIYDESKTLRASKSWPIGQRISEYIKYMSKFPKLLSCDKTKLKNKLEEILGFKDFENLTVKELNLGRYSDFTILDKYSVEHGISLK